MVNDIYIFFLKNKLKSTPEENNIKQNVQAVLPEKVYQKGT